MIDCANEEALKIKWVHREDRNALCGLEKFGPFVRALRFQGM